ncbi:MAG: hypothetical protein HKN88_03690 [Gammaproteobacteria bacterium]|nr:hypothetical protein [Gammaproteobacteria bacterium]NNM13095.1 hypothetical protein [Gammaproteobacteria bacterium]
MKKSIISIVTILAMAFGTSLALQAGHHKNGMHAQHHQGMMHQKMLDKVKATDEQKAQIKAIHDKYHPEMQALKESGKAMKAQNKDLDPASSDYVTRVQAMASEKARIMQEKARIHAQVKHESALVLSDEQRAELKAIKAKHKAKRAERKEKRQERRKKRFEENQ